MILQDIRSQVTVSLKSGDKASALTLRSVLASLHNAKISQRRELTDDEAVAVLRQELKKRIEAEEAFHQAGRAESAQNEAREKELIAGFLPAALSSEELDGIISEVLEMTADKNNFGLLMKAVMAKAGTRVEGGRVAAALKAKMSA